ncbi:MAG: NAD-dependent succinate-semialdehyde dehydrogenase [Oligoflexus sp.]
MMKSMNPATGELLKEYQALNNAAIEQALNKAEEAFFTWRTTSIQERSDHLKSVSELLRKDKFSYGKLITEEMGKPIEQSVAEIEKCAAVCEYYVEHGADFLAEKLVDTGPRKSKISYQPLGPILAIMPWNFPFWQVFRFLAPNLMAGNVALLKHASNVSGCSLAIADILVQAGLPEGVMQSLLIDSQHAEKLLRDERIKAVTLTGSNRAGAAIGKIAGELVKKSVLELGGSDAYVILDDADIELAAKTCAASRLINSGQSCIAAKRFIVVNSVKEEFQAKLVEQMAKVKLGDPMDNTVGLGPLARDDIRQDIAKQVQESVKKGAHCLLGGHHVDSPGFYYEATVLTDVKPGMPVFDEEVFGPVAAVVAAADEKGAIHLANQSRFGLGAAIFTRDLAKGESIATHELDAGTCVVNTMVKSDPRLPFGGIKKSGFGRELAEVGMHEFVNIKTVVINE